MKKKMFKMFFHGKEIQKNVFSWKQIFLNISSWCRIEKNFLHKKEILILFRIFLSDSTVRQVELTWYVLPLSPLMLSYTALYVGAWLIY